MTKFILVRHGQTVDNGNGTIQGWTHSSLTELGHEQAKQVAANLPSTPDLIFTSDLYRCQQTTEHIQETFRDIPTLSDWHIRERSFGHLQGQQAASIDWDKFWAVHDDDSFEGAEPVTFFSERIKSFVRSVQLFDVETVLVVTHGGVLNRFGHLFVDGFETQKYPNTAIVTYDIASDDPRLDATQPPAWRPYVKRT